ncbi:MULTISPECIES: fibrobacter succinogenes major paralogous domain-containing protein [unclassified Fibrobacter]|uniref:fibrobacter succinogenes major paralogous domain-containing protein n=1 Tax=unclassified Fibrobacter TaxID=2634177 RepID=UPI000D6DA79E|nr:MULTISPECIES: fibrobacter succinogenes major paralogous domain-containing protein [unclassified Fibrobacter]PWJ54303.1 uncharacterized protein (TIGR02145 family) [Fibrobacter sp. UWR4]PZW61314.1 uncharacterized protein (TIGR02145 family) [Fibrobacter sp. UWR1]
MKKNFLALGTCAFALALGLVACDDSTSANGSSGDENPAEESSSSVILSDSEGSSSSVTSSSSVESSSSVVSSSSEKSSSSVASSSSVKTSSSSAKSGSSVASSSSAKSSSSSVVSSSSSSSAPTEDPSDSKLAWQYLNPDIDYGEFTDTRDGQVYKTVTIGTQTWMAQNLNYNPGDVSDMGSYAWSGCYKNKADSCAKYGRLYTWEVAMNDASCAFDKVCKAPLNPTTPVQGICPEGWHLPSHYEFEELINYIDPTFRYNHTDDAYSSTAGKYLKSKSGWNSNGNGTDAYGFSALPGGIGYNDGDFSSEGNFAFFWSSGENVSYYRAFYLNLDYDNDRAYLYWRNKNNAKSVRCLKD